MFDALTAPWVLIVITMWEPSMFISIDQATFNSMNECLAKREVIIKEYADKDKDFHFNVGCEPIWVKESK